jgi:hypothetical protein
MDKKTGGMIAFVATILCCGLPGCFSLCMGSLFAFAGVVPGSNIDIGGSSDPQTAIVTGIAMICGAIIFIAIPVAVGFFTLRNKPAPAPVAQGFNDPLPPAS